MSRVDTHAYEHRLAEGKACGGCCDDSRDYFKEKGRERGFYEGCDSERKSIVAFLEAHPNWKLWELTEHISFGTHVLEIPPVVEEVEPS